MLGIVAVGVVRAILTMSRDLVTEHELHTLYARAHND